MMTRTSLAIVTLLPWLLGAAPARQVAVPLALAYAPQRTLHASEALRLDWKDAARDRAVPAKIYFPADAAGPFPIIIFSHGLGGTRESYEYLARQWAANGYVALHLQHVGTDDTAWRGQSRPMESMRRAITGQGAIDRAGDVKFAIDQLTMLNRDHEKLKGKLDLERIGMAGHSFGAHTTLSVAGQGRGSPMREPRVKAAIALSPTVPAKGANLENAFAGVSIPVFHMTGTKDDSPLGDTRAAARRIAFDHSKSAAYLLILDGADHMVFSGRLAPRPGDEASQRLVRLASTAFFDAYLTNDNAAKKWLDDGDFARQLAAGDTFEQK